MFPWPRADRIHAFVVCKIGFVDLTWFPRNMGFVVRVCMALENHSISDEYWNLGMRKVLSGRYKRGANSQCVTIHKYAHNTCYLVAFTQQTLTNTNYVMLFHRTESQRV